MKNLMPTQCNLDANAVSSVQESKDCKDLYDIMQKDFWVVSPCHSTAQPNTILEGTRITIQFAPPEGYEFSIRTPGTPSRWEDYNKEMTFIWNSLTSEASKPDMDLERTSDLILMLTFYWYNFMPLSRGSAAVGYTTMLGLFLALGIDLPVAIPKDLQPDWEAILRPTAFDFIDVIKPWLYPSRVPTNIINTLPVLSLTCPTLRHLFEILNCVL